MPNDQDPDASDTTREAEQDDETQGVGADREPTPEEEAAAESALPLDEKVAENYERQSKIGADAKGEGQID
ncbi:MAG: hypothetical protein ACR2MB_17480 [Acidimicrobiales bacterium]